MRHRWTDSDKLSRLAIEGIDPILRPHYQLDDACWPALQRKEPGPSEPRLSGTRTAEPGEHASGFSRFLVADTHNPPQPRTRSHPIGVVPNLSLPIMNR